MTTNPAFIKSNEFSGAHVDDLIDIVLVEDAMPPTQDDTKIYK